MKKITLQLFIAILTTFVGFAQGSQDFETQTALTTSYADNSFTEDGITYTYVHCRNEGLGTNDDYSINGKGIILRRPNEPSSLEWTISDGVGILTFDARKAFTGGSNNRQLEVLVNGTSVWISPTFGTSGADTTVHNFSVPINEQGSTTIKIQLVGSNGNRQVTIDNISWTGYVVPTEYCMPTGFVSSSSYYISIASLTGVSSSLGSSYQSGTAFAYYDNSSSGNTVVPNSSFTLSMTQNTGTGLFYAWIDWNNNFSFDDTGENVFATTSPSGTATATINVPNGIPNGIYRMRLANSQSGTITSACGPADFGGFIDFSIFVNSAPVCSDEPNAGTVTVTPTNGPAGSTYEVTATGYSANSGLLFMWEKSTDNGDSWNFVSMMKEFLQPIEGEIAPPNDGDKVQYRLTVFCLESGEDSESNIATFTTGTGEITYCVPSYTNTDDYTSAFSTKVNGTTFANYTATSQTGTMGYDDLSSDSSYNTTVIAGETFTFSHTFFGSFSNGNTLRLWIDWNNNGVFDDDEQVYNNYSTNAIQSSDINVPMSVQEGNYRMRVRSRWGNVIPGACSSESYGQALDMTIVVTPLTACSGTPNAGTITITPSEAGQGELYNVTASGFGINSGLTFQWQKYNETLSDWEDYGTSNSFYQALIGEIAPDFGTQVQYRLKVSCDVGETAYSNEASFTTGYCLPSYTSSLDYTSVFSTSVGGTTFANYTSSNQTGTNGYNNLSGDASYNTIAKAGETIQVSHTYSDNSHTLRIWMDWNKNGTFEDSEEVVNNYFPADTQTVSFNVPDDQAPGEYRMRMRSTYSTAIPEACSSENWGQALDFTLVVNCPTIAPPTGEANQTFEEGQTISDLVVSGTNLVFYNSTYSETFNLTDELVDNQTYYVVSKVGICMSDPLIIIVTQVVNRTDFDVYGFSYYPNPVNDVLHFSSNSKIEKVVITNMIGQTINANLNSDNTILDMSDLPTGNYFVKVTIEGISKTIKVIKK